MNLGFVLLYEDDSPLPPASDNVKAPDALFPPDIAVYTTISPVILGLISAVVFLYQGQKPQIKRHILVLLMSLEIRLETMPLDTFPAVGTLLFILIRH